jgi:hypothetical protein
MDTLAAEANDVRAGTVTAREGQIIDLWVGCGTR